MPSVQHVGVPSAEFHPPEELLATAMRLLRQNDPSLYRAVLLEAIAALETAVERTIFPLLEQSLGQPLVAWLKQRTLMDFDSRLSPLATHAIGRKIDIRADPLWADYKQVKQWRNRAVHRGTRVTREQAEFALRTVEAWLSLLGATAQVDVALWMIKHYVERSRPPVGSPNERGYADLVARVFSKARALSVRVEPQLQFEDETLRPDFVVAFGNVEVVVQTKMLREPPEPKVLDAAARQALAYAGEKGRAAVLLFCAFDLNSELDGVFQMAGGRASGVGVRLPT